MKIDTGCGQVVSQYEGSKDSTSIRNRLVVKMKRVFLKDTGFRLMRKRPFKAITSVVALWSFMFSMVTGDFAWAARMTVEPSRVGSNSAGGSGSLDVSKVAVPLQFGEIREISIGNNGKTIIHIQDAHCNYGAQTSIQGIISHLADTYNVDLLSLEGGKGNYDLSIFTSIADNNVRSKVSDYFVKEGRVSGAESFAINNPGKVKLFGIEDENLYNENLKAYRDSLVYKEDVGKYLNAVSLAIENLKRKVYSPELKALDERIASYRDSKIEFKDHLTYIKESCGALKVDISSFKGIAALLTILNDEKGINFKEAGRERNTLIDKLNKALSKAALEEFVKKTVLFKAGAITSEEYYAYLFKKAQFTNVDFSNLPNLVKYSEYLRRYESLDKTAVMKDITALEEALFAKVISKDDERSLYSLDKNLRIIKGLFNIALTKDEFSYYQAHKDEFRVNSFTSFINDRSSKYGFGFKLNDGIGKLDSYRENMEKFYKCSLKRDEVFLKNIASKLASEKKTATILVTGGFHTENLSRLFKDNGYSYISIMPKFGSQEGENQYFKLLSGKNTPFEEFLKKAVTYTPQNSNLAVRSLFSEMNVNINDERMIDLEKEVLANVLTKGSFIIQTDRGRIEINKGARNADAPAGFEVELTGGMKLSASIYTAQGRMFDKYVPDVVLLDGNKMSIEAHEQWIDRLGISVGTHDIDKNFRDMIIKDLKDLGFSDEQIKIIFRKDHEYKIWNKSIGLTLAHNGSSGTVDKKDRKGNVVGRERVYGRIYLSPDLEGRRYMYGYGYLIAILHELGAMYKVEEAHGAFHSELDLTKKEGRAAFLKAASAVLKKAQNPNNKKRIDLAMDASPISAASTQIASLADDLMSITDKTGADAEHLLRCYGIAALLRGKGRGALLAADVLLAEVDHIQKTGLGHSELMSALFASRILNQDRAAERKLTSADFNAARSIIQAFKDKVDAAAKRAARGDVTMQAKPVSIASLKTRISQMWAKLDIVLQSEYSTLRGNSNDVDTPEKIVAYVNDCIRIFSQNISHGVTRDALIKRNDQENALRDALSSLKYILKDAEKLSSAAKRDVTMQANKASKSPVVKTTLRGRFEDVIEGLRLDAINMQSNINFLRPALMDDVIDSVFYARQIYLSNGYDREGKIDALIQIGHNLKKYEDEVAAEIKKGKVPPMGKILLALIRSARIRIKQETKKRANANRAVERDARGDVTMQAKPTNKYDNFVNNVVMTASNEADASRTAKQAWLASYDTVVSFIEAVKAEISPEDIEAFAPIIHDKGYFKGQNEKIQNPQHPFIGGSINLTDEQLKDFLTEAGYTAYKNRYAQGRKGFRFTLEIVRKDKRADGKDNRAEFYKALGKNIPQEKLDKLAEDTPIINANAMSWEDMVSDARNYPNPQDRLQTIKNNQVGAMASVLAWVRSSRELTDEEKDKITAIIYRYAGHYSGKYAFDGLDENGAVRPEWAKFQAMSPAERAKDENKKRCSQYDPENLKVAVVSVPYASLSEDEKDKDRPIWRAVLDVQKQIADAKKTAERDARGDVSMTAKPVNIESIKRQIADILATLKKGVKISFSVDDLEVGLKQLDTPEKLKNYVDRLRTRLHDYMYEGVVIREDLIRYGEWNATERAWSDLYGVQAQAEELVRRTSRGDLALSAEAGDKERSDQWSDERPAAVVNTSAASVHEAGKPIETQKIGSLEKEIRAVLERYEAAQTEKRQAELKAEYARMAEELAKELERLKLEGWQRVKDEAEKILKDMGDVDLRKPLISWDELMARFDKDIARRNAEINAEIAAKLAGTLKLPDVDTRLNTELFNEFKPGQGHDLTLSAEAENKGKPRNAAPERPMVDINDIAKAVEDAMRKIIYDSRQPCALRIGLVEIDEKGTPMKGQRLLDDLEFSGNIYPDFNVHSKVIAHLQALLAQFGKHGFLSYRLEPDVGKTYVKGSSSPLITLRVEVPLSSGTTPGRDLAMGKEPTQPWTRDASPIIETFRQVLGRKPTDDEIGMIRWFTDHRGGDLKTNAWAEVAMMISRAVNKHSKRDDHRVYVASVIMPIFKEFSRASGRLPMLKECEEIMDDYKGAVRNLIPNASTIKRIVENYLIDHKIASVAEKPAAERHEAGDRADNYDLALGVRSSEGSESSPAGANMSAEGKYTAMSLSEKIVESGRLHRRYEQLLSYLRKLREDREQQAKRGDDTSGIDRQIIEQERLVAQAWNNYVDLHNKLYPDKQLIRVPLPTSVIMPAAPVAEPYSAPSVAPTALTPQNWGPYMENLGSTGLDIMNTVYPGIFTKNRPAAILIELTRDEWDLMKSQCTAVKAAANAISRKLNNDITIYYCCGREGREEMAQKLSSFGKDNVISFVHGKPTDEGMQNVSGNSYTTMYMNDATATPIAGCCETALALLVHSYLLNEKNDAAAAAEVAPLIISGVKAMSGGAVSYAALEDWAKEIRAGNLSGISFLVPITPVEPSKIAQFHSREAEVMRSI